MMFNIDPDWTVKLALYKICGVMILILAVYALIWVKVKVKRPLFKPYPVKEVMAMENELYAQYHMSK